MPTKRQYFLTYLLKTSVLDQEGVEELAHEIHTEIKENHIIDDEELLFVSVKEVKE